jgi:hypothetical protein
MGGPSIPFSVPCTSKVSSSSFVSSSVTLVSLRSSLSATGGRRTGS